MRLRIFGSMPLCVLFVVSAAARAAPLSSDPRLAQARRFCESGDARAAVLLYSQIYVETLDPIFVYQQAACYQRNGADEKAIERYRAYLRVARHVSPQERERIQTRVVELSARWLASAAPTTAPPASADPEPGPEAAVGRVRSPGAEKPAPAPPALVEWPPPPAVRPARPAPAAQIAAARPPPAAPAPPPSQRRLYSLLAATAAGATLGGAVTLHVAREESAREFNRACYPFKLDGCQELKSRVTVRQTAAVATYAGAALLAALSTYFYVTTKEAPPAAGKAPLALGGCTPMAAGLSCAARF